MGERAEGTLNRALFLSEMKKGLGGLGGTKDGT